MLIKAKNHFKKTVRSDIFLIASAVFLFSLIFFFRYCFLGISFAFDNIGSDTIRICIPSYYSYFDKLASGSSIFYSLDMGIGNTFLTHSSIVFDPFTYILFIFGRSNIEKMLIWYAIIKIVAAAMSFNLYLSYFKISRNVKLVSCICYAFSGFMIIMGQNYVFSTILVYFPLILLFTEKFLSKKSFIPLIIIQALTALYFYYFFYMTAIFVAIYYIYRFHRFGKIKSKKFIIDTLKFFIINLCAVACAMFFLLPNLYQATTSSRGAGDLNLLIDKTLFGFMPHAFFTFLARLISPDILGSSTVYSGYYGDYFELACFNSILAVLILPQFYKFSDKKTRKLIIFVIVSIALVLLVAIFPFAFNAFRDITYRFSFIITFILSVSIAFGVEATIMKKKIDSKILFWTIAVIVFLSGLIPVGTAVVRTVFLKQQFVYHFKIVLAVLIPISLFSAVFILVKHEKLKKISVIIFLIIACVLTENFVAYFDWTNNRSNVYNNMQANHTGYFDTSNDLIERIKKSDGTVFRLEKNFDSVVATGIPSNNDSMMQKYYGTKLYSSINNPNYINFLQDLGIIVGNPFVDYPDDLDPHDIRGQTLNYINGVGDRHDLLSYLGVKYYIDNKNEVLPENFVLKEEYQDLNLYYNNNYFPLAFVQSEYIDFKDFMTLDKDKKDINIYQYAILDENIKTPAIKTDVSNDLSSKEKTEIAFKHQKAAEVKIISESKISINITVEKDGIVTFTVPYQKGWSVYIDGRKTEKFIANLGLLAANIMTGEHSVTIEYKAEYFKEGTVISLFALSALIITVVFVLVKKRRKQAEK